MSRYRHRRALRFVAPTVPIRKDLKVGSTERAETQRAGRAARIRGRDRRPSRAGDSVLEAIGNTTQALS